MATMLARRPAESGGKLCRTQAAADDERSELRALLQDRTLKRGNYPLSSGGRSRIYFNVKTTMMNARGAALCGRTLLRMLRALNADYIAGLEMGAVPLLSVVAAFSSDEGQPIGAFFVRKQPKAHGTQLLIEGLDEEGGETLDGRRVVLVDDVATTGGSILKAVDQIEAAGGIMTDAIVVLDREEGAMETLRERGITLHHLFTASDLGVTQADRLPIE